MSSPTPTPRRQSTASRSSLVLSPEHQRPLAQRWRGRILESWCSGRLASSRDRWAHSLLGVLLLCLLAGYGSTRLPIPQGVLSLVLTSLGALCLLLALLSGLSRAGGLRATKRCSRLITLSLALGLTLGARLYYVGTLEALEHPLHIEGTEVEARLIDSPMSRDRGQSWDVELLTGEARGRRLRLYTRDTLIPQVGDRLTLQIGRCQSLGAGELAPHYRDYLLSLGLSGTASTRGIHHHPTPTKELLLTHPTLLPLRYRDHLRARVSTLGLSDYAETLLVGITLGYMPRDEVGRGVRREFASGAAAHLLAVSGFHLAVVVGALALLLRQLPGLRQRQRLRWGILVLGGWAFALLTGCSIPTLRAALMLTLYAGVRMLGRPASLPEVIALPALLQLLVSPTTILSVSLPLTYLALLGIYLFYRPIYQSVGRLRSQPLGYLWSGIALTLSVQPLMLPLSLYFFGYSSLAFVFTALPLTLLATLLIPVFLVVLLLLGLGLGTLPASLVWMLETLAQLMRSLTQAFSGTPLLHLRYSLGLPELLTCYTLLIVGLLAARLYREQHPASSHSASWEMEG